MAAGRWVQLHPQICGLIMLTHKIVKFKPTIQVSQQSTFYKNKSPILTQKALEEHLTQQHGVGVLIRYNSGAGPDVYSPSQVNCVIYIERNIEHIKYNFNGWPESHLIMQCDESMAKPWVRWVDPREYVLLSQKDQEKYSNDHLQNYIQEVKSTNATYLEAISRSQRQTNVDGQVDAQQEVQQRTTSS